MINRISIRAIIIQNHKLLLLKGKNHTELWEPGGKVELNESDEECLRRELMEEINTEIISFKHFGDYPSESFYHKDENILNKIYLVEIKNEPRPTHEIESIVWYSKDDFYNKKYHMIPVIENKIIPDLIKRGMF